MTNKKLTLVVAPSRKTRGGITAVVAAYENTLLWTKWNCKWIETHIDRGFILKFSYFLKSFFYYLYLLPNCKIVHIHLSEPVSAIRKSFFFFIAKLLNKKTIIHFHSFSPETTINSKFSKLYKLLFSKADMVIVLSSYWEKEIKKKIDNATVNIVFNPCTYPKSTLEKKEPTDNDYILYAGTITNRKGYKDLITAFSLISNDFPSWKIVFAGNGEIELAKQIAEDCGISTKVEFKGWVSGNDKVNLFNNASIFCLPSYAEGFPMAVLDAAVYGLPIVTTPVGGVPDVFNDNINALIFNPGDINTLASKLERLIKDEHLRLQLGEASRKLSVEVFSMTTIEKDMEKLYSQL